MVTLAIPVVAIAANGLSLFLNLLFTFSDLVGVGIAHQWSMGLGGLSIAPAAYGLAIWGAIYLGLLAAIAYQFGLGQGQRVSRQRWREPLFRRVDQLLMGAVLGQALWAGLFAAQLWLLAAVAMVPVLICLIAAYRRLEIGQRWTSARRAWLCHAPISIYLGWAAVLTVVTVAMGLYGLGWQSAGLGWGLVVILALALGSALMVLRYEDVWFGLAVAWGLGMVAAGQRYTGLLNLITALATLLLVFWVTWVKNRVVGHGGQ
ncbi:MAG: hypothetical protein VKL98_00720 [Cyanobacteriota bacterium]|nr:hypothetical protein [Cyanobacteriota bacterium]